ncbi:MAG: DUF86 domain-containing protein [Opitutales bacterium]|nr:DUF86 domain-containing protein [Opitutales bacterium]
MSRLPLEFLKHIHDELCYLDETSRMISHEEFSRNATYQRAFARSFEIIGGATKQLDDEFRKQPPKILWSYMAKMRDKLIHHYFGIDYQMVWHTVEEDVPELKASVRQILGQAQQ